MKARFYKLRFCKAKEKKLKELEIQFLGTRGTMPVNSKEFEIFGGATVCTLVKSKDSNIILDAGTGLMHIEDYIDIKEQNELNILISHPHIDHILGLLASKIMFNSKIKINIYSVKRDNVSVKEQINILMKDPIWPVDVSAFMANVNFIDIKDYFEIKDFKISEIKGNHTGYSSVFKIEYKEQSIVYATDFEIDENSIDKLIDFSKNTDLLICDGQYSDETKKDKIGFGHSSWQEAVLVADKANANMLSIFHHDPYSTDEYLLEIEKNANMHNENYSLARKGARIYI